MHALEQRIVPAMGTTARVTVVGGGVALADHAVRRIDELERRWSRFLPDSELSRLNASGGSPCIVSADTFRLIDALVDAWWTTDGRFDPTMVDALRAVGYSQSWPFLEATTPSDLSDLHDITAPGCADIRRDPALHMVWLPVGVQLDPGGLGKGLAADIVAEELMAEGAEGVVVDLGGDLRVIGESPTGAAWRIGVEHPGDVERTIAVVETTDGGIATTSRGKRRWALDGGRHVHHVLDPASCAPAERTWLSATALAASAAAAEVGATVTFLEGHTDATPHVFAALLADFDGTIHVVGDRPELFAPAVAT